MLAANALRTARPRRRRPPPPLLRQLQSVLVVPQLQPPPPQAQDQPEVVVPLPEVDRPLLVPGRMIPDGSSRRLAVRPVRPSVTGERPDFRSEVPGEEEEAVPVVEAVLD